MHNIQLNNKRTRKKKKKGGGGDEGEGVAVLMHLWDKNFYLVKNWSYKGHLLDGFWYPASNAS